jgi:hypothetical protein
MLGGSPGRDPVGHRVEAAVRHDDGLSLSTLRGSGFAKVGSRCLRTGREAAASRGPGRRQGGEAENAGGQQNCETTA